MSPPRGRTATECVAAARERVSDELDFIGYVERPYLAAEGGAHHAE